MSGTIFVARAVSTTVGGLNEQLTVAAWDAFNDGDYMRAIANASKCIAEFQAAADREQAELEEAKGPSPAVGAVTDAEKAKIVDRGCGFRQF